MDSIRSISVVSVAQFMVLGALSPVFAESSEDDLKHHGLQGRSKSHAVSHCREDYPVIWSWISSSDNSEPTPKSEQKAS